MLSLFTWDRHHDKVWPERDPEYHARWLATADVAVARNEVIPGVVVETVFDGIDDGKQDTPLVFLTAVSGGRLDGHRARSPSHQAALETHAALVADIARRGQLWQPCGSCGKPGMGCHACGGTGFVPLRLTASLVEELRRSVTPDDLEGLGQRLADIAAVESSMSALRSEVERLTAENQRLSTPVTVEMDRPNYPTRARFSNGIAIQLVRGGGAPYLVVEGL